jgi:hypothetical protein
MTFTALALRELDFHSHHAGYGDPYGIEFAADSRAAELEPHPAAWLRDYGKYVNGAYELSAMGWPGLDDLPDPWS